MLPELDREVARLADEHSLPGFAVGVLHGDDTYVCTAGVTSTADPLPVTPETLFHIGSTTKTMTATALMALVERGQVALADLVVGHWPALTREDWAGLTVGMLLNHTAGFRGDTLAETGWGDDALARSVSETIAQQPQFVPPGQIMSYNNAAFGLAGRLIEVVTGETYEAAVKRLVLDPLGMGDTFLLPWEAANRRTAVGHAAGKPMPGWPMPRSGNPFGGAVSSVVDQLAYARFHLTGGPVLSVEARLLMQQPTVQVRSGVDGVGVGWLLKHQRGTPLVTHGGNVNNLHVSTFALAPEHGLAVTTLANASAGNAAGEAVLDWVLEHLAGLPADPPLPVLPARDEYAGRYDAGQWFQDVTFVDGELYVAMVLPESSEEPEIRALFDRPPVRLAVIGEDLVATAAKPTVAVGDFIRRADGSIGWLRYGLRLASRVPAQRTN